MKYLKKFESTDKVSDINKAFGSISAEQGVIKKIIQYLVQGRDLEASSFGKKELVDEIRAYLNQIPFDTMQELSKKNGEEIQNIFSGESLEELIKYLKGKNLIR